MVQIEQTKWKKVSGHEESLEERKVPFLTKVDARASKGILLKHTSKGVERSPEGRHPRPAPDRRRCRGVQNLQIQFKL